MTTISYQKWLDLLCDPNSDLQFDAWGYSDHAHRPVPVEDRILDMHLLWFIVDHGYSGTVNGRNVDLHAGTMSWITAGTHHSFIIPQGLRSYRLRLALRQDGVDLHPPGDILLARNAWELQAPFEHILAELQVHQPFREQRLRLLAGTLASLTFRHQIGPSTQHCLSTTQRFALGRLVETHLTGQLTPADLAAECKLTPDYFARVFKRTYALSPRAWLVRERLRHAATALLESDEPINAIARSCGFEDANLFTRQFKKVYGYSPKQHRRK